MYNIEITQDHIDTIASIATAMARELYDELHVGDMFEGIAKFLTAKVEMNSEGIFYITLGTSFGTIRVLS